MSQALTSVPAPIWTPGNREYHGDPSRWSSTSLKMFRHKPQLAYRTYIGSVKHSGPTPAQVIGSAVNILLLEPETQETAIHTVDVEARNAVAFKKAVELYPEALVLTRPEREQAGAVADAILHPQTDYAAMAREILVDRHGYSEYASRWDDEIGVPCKSKIDRLTTATAEDGLSLVIGELKTAKSPELQAFSRQAWDLDYHCQAAFNCRGIYATTGHWPDFVFVVVRNEQPYEVACYKLTEEFLAVGYEQVVGDLQRLSVCLQDPSGKTWRSSWENFQGFPSVPELSPPPYRRAAI